MTIDIEQTFKKLEKSKFRSHFFLSPTLKQYMKEKGSKTIKKHAEDLIQKRLAPAIILNDGKQTPMKGHPVFVAQHATATCCRGCLYKWYHIPKNRELTKSEQEQIVAMIMAWLEKQLLESVK